MASTRSRMRGAVMIAMAAVLSLALATVFVAGVAGHGARAARDRASDRALAAAKEALIAYAVGRPVDAIVGPGYLPCPDLDGDGWAEPTCGSQSGETGQTQRLGRLPWKTLAIPEVRDGYGEWLWYAVSSKHKGLLNCTVSAACLDMSPRSALGTISVRDASGVLVHDGRIAEPGRAASGGAAAVVFAPGAALERWEDATGTRRRVQARGCTGPCDPADFLDKAPGEDNADFIDRNDAAGRAANANGFIQGPVGRAGALAVNDRLIAIAYDDLMPRVTQRVAQEVAHCLRALDVLPDPAPPCHVPDEAFARCTIAPDAALHWWNAWRPHVHYARLTGQDFRILVRGGPAEPCPAT